jgi:dipeptidyl aminopeptidase/acylaminoacyl peptidase
MEMREKGFDNSIPFSSVAHSQGNPHICNPRDTRGKKGARSVDLILFMEAAVHNSRKTVPYLWARALALVALTFILFCAGRVDAEPASPQIEDLYKTDTATSTIPLPGGKAVVYIRQRVDPQTRTLVQSLWRFDNATSVHAMEAGEPNAFNPILSPDGKWLAFLSTRAFPDGTPAFTPVPPYSDTAADIWLIPASGGKAVPLGGKGKPYGRVITDSFYGRVAFSPDGKKLVFVADLGRDVRSDAERRNHVIQAREDQGEGYEGYGPTQVWVADLMDTPEENAASHIARVTEDDFWYGDPQWSPDGAFLVVHANRTAEQESVRYSINQNYDLWKITLADRHLEQLTNGPGPEFSPRISPDGKRVVCLSSPRRGPHMDVFNLMVVELSPRGVKSSVVFDHHGKDADHPPHLSPSFPLPADCWLDDHRVMFAGMQGVKDVWQVVDLDAGPQAGAGTGSAKARASVPGGNTAAGPRLHAVDELVHWKSFDGLEIEGILTRPPASIAKPPYRLLLMPHGGPHSRSTSGTGFDVQIFATRGFAVFQPNFRGSVGYGVKFLDADRYDFGGGDMRDILAGIDHLAQQGIIDPKRQFVYGVSYGGYMTSWLVGHTTQFRAAVAQNAVTDLNVMWYLGDLQSWGRYDLGGRAWEVAQLMTERSPITYASKVKTPTLILHSLNDRRCPVAMGKMFYRALKEASVETEMVMYPDEGHPIRQLPHREDVLRRVLEWFEKHDATGKQQ